MAKPVLYNPDCPPKNIEYISVKIHDPSEFLTNSSPRQQRCQIIRIVEKNENVDPKCNARLNVLQAKGKAGSCNKQRARNP